MASRTEFPRVFGGIVHDSFSVVSFFTGLLAALPTGIVLVLVASGPPSRGDGVVLGLVWTTTVLLFVSRFAQLGAAGDSDGGLFSTSAGPWSGTVAVAARLLLLQLAWAVPVFAWAALGSADAVARGAAIGSVPLAVPRVPVLLSLWVALGVVLAFAFVALASAAPGPADVFSPGLWATLFSGRTGELLLAMAGTFGPPLAVFAVALPVTVAILPSSPKLAATIAVPLLVYALGMVLSLQGRLCGAFAAAVLAEEEPGTSAVEAAPAPAVAVPAAVVTAAAAATATAPAAAAKAPVPGAVPVPTAPPAPDAAALRAAWEARVAAGDADGALAAAREAIPATLARGDAKTAAAVYRQHLDRLPELGLDRAALDVLADQLLRDGDVAASAWTYSQALDAEPGDVKAFKGLLRVAEHHLEKEKSPLEAVRVYHYLLQRSPASPFADHARDLLADAERRAARGESAPPVRS